MGSPSLGSSPVLVFSPAPATALDDVAVAGSGAVLFAPGAILGTVGRVGDMVAVLGTPGAILGTASRVAVLGVADGVDALAVVSHHGSFSGDVGVGLLVPCFRDGIDAKMVA